MKPEAFHELAAAEDRHWWYVGMRANALKILARHTPGGRGLDVGCATGAFTQMLPGPGPHLGVDVNRLPLSIGRSLDRPRLAQASAESLPFAAAGFDLITSLDVLYHADVGSDRRALAEFYRVLAPGGVALIQVPAYPWLRSRHDDDVATRERYTASSLEDRLTGAGFRVLRLTYANALLLPAAVVWRLLTRVRSSIAARELAVPLAPVNTILTGLLALEGAWLARADLPAGLSLIAVVTRPEE